MSAKKFDCPYCGHRMRDVFNEIASGKHEVTVNNVVTLCMGCGEPIFMEMDKLRQGWRKPTHNEFEHMIADPGMAASRAAWLHMQTARPDQLLVLKSYKQFVEGFPFKLKDEDAEFITRTIYMVAFSNAFRLLMDLGDMDKHDDGYFDMQVALIKAELNVFHDEAYAKIDEIKSRRKT